MAAVKQPALAGLGLDDYVQGGLIDDVDVEIVSLRAVLWNYGGEIKDEVLAVCGTFKEIHSGEISQIYFSAGTGFVPAVPDGTGFVAAEGSGKTALTRGTNWHIFHKSLHDNGGLPANKLREPGGLSLLDGAVIHIKRVPAPERPGLATRGAESAFPKTIPICSAPALRWPWEAKGKKPAAVGAARPAAGAPTAAPAADTAESLALDGLMKAFGDTDSMDVTALKKAVFAAIGPGADKTLRAQATKLVVDPDWLSSQGYLLEGAMVEKIPV